MWCYYGQLLKLLWGWIKASCSLRVSWSYFVAHICRMWTRWVQLAIFYLLLYCKQKICVTCEGEESGFGRDPPHVSPQCPSSSAVFAWNGLIDFQAQKKAWSALISLSLPKVVLKTKAKKKKCRMWIQYFRGEQRLVPAKVCVAGLFSSSGGRGKKKIERLRYWRGVESRETCCETLLCVLGSQRLWRHNHTKYTHVSAALRREGGKRGVYVHALWRKRKLSHNIRGLMNISRFFFSWGIFFMLSPVSKTRKSGWRQ